MICRAHILVFREHLEGLEDLVIQENSVDTHFVGNSMDWELWDSLESMEIRMGNMDRYMGLVSCVVFYC